MYMSNCNGIVIWINNYIAVATRGYMSVCTWYVGTSVYMGTLMYFK